MALAAEKKLRSYGKTLLQATDFYVTQLQADQQRRDSASASTPAQQWYEYKRSGETKQLRTATPNGIQDASSTSAVDFPKFFNWAIARGHLTINPCERIKIHVGEGRRDYP